MKFNPTDYWMLFYTILALGTFVLISIFFVRKEKTLLVAIFLFPVCYAVTKILTIIYSLTINETYILVSLLYIGSLALLFYFTHKHGRAISLQRLYAGESNLTLPKREQRKRKKQLKKKERRRRQRTSEIQKQKRKEQKQKELIAKKQKTHSRHKHDKK